MSTQIRDGIEDFLGPRQGSIRTLCNVNTVDRFFEIKVLARNYLILREPHSLAMFHDLLEYIPSDYRLQVLTAYFLFWMQSFALEMDHTRIEISLDDTRIIAAVLQSPSLTEILINEECTTLMLKSFHCWRNVLAILDSANRYHDEFIGLFEEELKRQKRLVYKRLAARISPYKEELIAKAWEPRRVERFLEMGVVLEDL